MAKARYSVRLSKEEKDILNQIIDAGKESERTILRARILLMSDEAYSPRLSLLELAEALKTTHTTIQTTRSEYSQGGVEKAVYRKDRVVPVENRRINAEVREAIKKLAASDPPEGHKKWTLRLLCQVAEEQGIVDHICHATLRKILLEDTSEDVLKV